ncbi:hypothetical protein [Streptomyces buecherae]|uniref:hypothetical protein n=1 Tax=Streptomyces buecherae TaxID=2763006 RepID=UPI00378C41FA
MTERRRYWDEDAQSWRDSSDRDARPTVTHPPPPTPPHRLGGPVMWAVAATFLVLGVLTVLGASRFDGDDNADADRKPDCSALAASPSASADGSGASEPSVDPLPASEVCDDKVGFRTAVPKGWKRTEARAIGTFNIDYDDPHGDRYLQVFDLPESTPSASIEGLRQENGFEEIKDRGCVSDERGGTQCGMEYSSSMENETPWYVVEYHFKAADGAVYGVASFVDTGQLDGARKVADAAFRHFRPPKEKREST